MCVYVCVCVFVCVCVCMYAIKYVCLTPNAPLLVTNVAMPTIVSDPNFLPDILAGTIFGIIFRPVHVCMYV